MVVRAPRRSNSRIAIGILGCAAALLVSASAVPRSNPDRLDVAAGVHRAKPSTKSATKTREPTRTTAAVPTTTPPPAPGTPVRIAVIDTGVAPVGGLAAHLLPGDDLVDATGSTADGNGHGTAMATIAENVCSSCTIVPVRAIGSDGTGTSAAIAQGVQWAVANGARVINLSLSGNAPDDNLTSAIESAVAAGVVVVIAAGNAGSTNPSGSGYPAASAPDAITVAAVDASGQLYSWSNHGPWVHFAAPGSLATLNAAGQPVIAIGTSSAAAYVSGTVGSLLTCNASLTPAQ